MQRPRRRLSIVWRAAAATPGRLLSTAASLPRTTARPPARINDPPRTTVQRPRGDGATP